ncbi:DUF6226 family protein [Segniliparus rugosus]|uniref:Uncharacterized protein n=1 Tax=Segniliparus rugosus (strain ATCC BAA-974 / DSM 45345 / CCUG 50838 / CIP 108380 / JCM 13579 / CDC 945) TaxID=679197 RepID=E5XQE9_SEGRC|nr:DUF6226 family protein [Segniliparus rugosus]EFV13432.1 hypothetical protein HMPREF9336_01721 [Segniliparus rugosus ATCC BAA-974]
MSAYRRPDVPSMVFLDASGTTIDYGNRWEGSPPDGTYSQAGNLERFAPLHLVADELIDYLLREYQVEAVETVSASGERTVELVPTNPDGARLTLRYADFPGVEIGAGLRKRVMLPWCGCDACDEPFEDCADALETWALGTAAGKFVEMIEHEGPHKGKPSVGYRMEGAGSGWQVVEADDAFEADAARLRGLPDGRWQSWPLRAEG